MAEANPKTPATSFNIVIVDPDKTIFEGSAKKAIIPTVKQDLAILPEHTPLYAKLQQGSIQLELDNGQTKDFEVTGGVLRVRDNEVSIVVGFDTNTE